MAKEALRPHPNLRVEGGHEAETRAFPGAKVLVLEAAQHPVPHVLQTAEVRGGEERRRLLQPIQARGPQGRNLTTGAISLPASTSPLGSFLENGSIGFYNQAKTFQNTFLYVIAFNFPDNPEKEVGLSSVTG